MTERMEWQSPPPPRHGYDWFEIARELKANPNQWLKVFDEGPTSIVNAIRQESVSAFTPVVRQGLRGGFEVRTRNNDPGPPRRCSLYLRWVPGVEGE